MKGFKYIVGIDEVGRGPVAGPVSVGAFCITEKSTEVVPEDLKNSKALSEKRREEWFTKFDDGRKQGLVDFVVASVESETIDERGIVFSLNHALKRAITKLSLDPKETYVYLDGGLKAPEEFTNQETIIKGDEKNNAIAAASIVAKVIRDRRMKKEGEKYPIYSFESNKGYGSVAHMTAIKEHGFCPIHRRSFLKSLGLPG